jgi:hypothetical protein
MVEDSRTDSGDRRVEEPGAEESRVKVHEQREDEVPSGQPYPMNGELAWGGSQEARRGVVPVRIHIGVRQRRHDRQSQRRHRGDDASQ